MGLSLARQMMADGHELFGDDNDPKRMKMLEAEGGTPVENAKALAERLRYHVQYIAETRTH